MIFMTYTLQIWIQLLSIKQISHFYLLNKLINLNLVNFRFYLTHSNSLLKNSIK